MQERLFESKVVELAKMLWDDRCFVPIQSDHDHESRASGSGRVLWS